MDISNRLNVSYPMIQSLPAVPVVADKPAVAPQVVSAPAASSPSGTSTRKDSDPEKKTEELEAAVKQMEKFFQSVHRNLEFSIDDKSGKVVVKVIATETGEVVRQLPSAEALKLADSLKNANSLLFEAKV
ncbi:flagellar protein FlaG [Pseudomonas petrae]|uniref:Flagellar protein FlaG n=1 Tax=Pseudomonas petrae TaxID=2912190 RepID=A0ABS9I4H3_9PSED|nr:flagellar protein FlaG [Pseudomonas petrae]MCF7533874.1 flagellar protein FlaG [Pseudomonas petrae]MCF7538421.1 flagellar protein FlaG [Pseudomonas petrae]MCF7542282.1 flagellar protein FlaG [Pseudomonas petrae]MCF7555786.1 flagellar protein FlaG [Pseudomonas petrae]